MSNPESTASRPNRRSGKRIARIDVVILVACFSVLATVAIPRQFELATEFRRADVASLAGSVNSAAQLANAFWVAAEQPDVLQLTRGDVAIINGFPSAATVAWTLESAETAAFNFAGGRWQHRDTPFGEPCGVTYEPPAVPGKQPRITLDQAGC